MVLLFSSGGVRHFEAACLPDWQRKWMEDKLPGMEEADKKFRNSGAKPLELIAGSLEKSEKMSPSAGLQGSFPSLSILHNFVAVKTFLGMTSWPSYIQFHVAMM